jgi:2,3-bisphosphoglycerate-independent phosphoglycerate mutase
MGAGIELEEGEIAFRANFATVDENMKVLDRRAGRETTGLDDIEPEINKLQIGVPFKFHHTVGHRGVLVLKGANLSEKVEDSDPHALVKVPTVKATDEAENSKNTARVVNEFGAKVHELLKDHPVNEKRETPVNMILLRGAGRYRKVQSFEEKYELKGACIAAVAIVRGVGAYLGLDVLDVEGATGDKNTDIGAKFRAARKALEEHDFVLINIKATDNFSHDGDYEGKREFIEKIDSNVPALIDGFEGVIAIMADHTTPVSVRDHCGDPVPLLISGSPVRPDHTKEFGETACMDGGLQRIRGTDLMPILINLAGKAELFGA